MFKKLFWTKKGTERLRKHNQIICFFSSEAFFGNDKFFGVFFY